MTWYDKVRELEVSALCVERNIVEIFLLLLSDQKVKG